MPIRRLRPRQWRNRSASDNNVSGDRTADLNVSIENKKALTLVRAFHVRESLRSAQPFHEN
jgi:hypothetical protein